MGQLTSAKEHLQWQQEAVFPPTLMCAAAAACDLYCTSNVSPQYSYGRNHCLLLDVQSTQSNACADWGRQCWLWQPCHTRARLRGSWQMYIYLLLEPWKKACTQTLKLKSRTNLGRLQKQAFSDIITFLLFSATFDSQVLCGSVLLLVYAVWAQLELCTLTDTAVCCFLGKNS